jgi:hypothetical protein
MLGSFARIVSPESCGSADQQIRLARSCVHVESLERSFAKPWLRLTCHIRLQQNAPIVRVKLKRGCVRDGAPVDGMYFIAPNALTGTEGQRPRNLVGIIACSEAQQRTAVTS